MVIIMNENNYYEKLNKLFDEVEDKLDDKFYDKGDALDWLSKRGYVERVGATYYQYYTEEHDYIGDDYKEYDDVYEKILDQLKDDDRLEEILSDLNKEE